MEFRAYIDVRSPAERPAADWERLHETLEWRAEAYGPIVSRHPDQPSASVEVIVSTEAAEAVDAGRMLTDAVYISLLAAGLGDCYVSVVDLEPVSKEDLQATA